MFDPGAGYSLPGSPGTQAANKNTARKAAYSKFGILDFISHLSLETLWVVD
jgi:hypothetical protein